MGPFFEEVQLILVSVQILWVPCEKNLFNSSVSSNFIGPFLEDFIEI